MPQQTRAPGFHVMAKPIGSTCNLRCSYCYYLPKEQLLAQKRATRMSPQVLEQYIRQTLDGQPGPDVGFSWQGGEPTLLGLDFFRQVVALQNRWRRPGQRIHNDLQTNGTLLDEAWCDFFARHDFLLGLSIDGPAALHDACRVDRRGRATLKRVLTAAHMLRQYQVPFSTLSVISRHNADAGATLYDFLTQEVGSHTIQLIPCVEAAGFAHTAPQYWPQDSRPRADDARALRAFVSADTVLPGQWGDFLCAFFDRWLQQGLGRVMVNLFESAVLQRLGYPALVCSSAERCGDALALEHDGSLYACDHYVYPEYRLGNITQQPLAQLVQEQRQQDFGKAKREHLAPDCLRCPWLPLCWGECPRNRFVRSADGPNHLNYLCPGIRQFFKHAMPALEAIAARLARAPTPRR